MPQTSRIWLPAIMCAKYNRTYEIHANGAYVRIGVCVVSKPQEQAWLANARITNQQQLEQVIAKNTNETHHQQLHDPNVEHDIEGGRVAER